MPEKIDSVILLDKLKSLGFSLKEIELTLMSERIDPWTKMAKITQSLSNAQSKREEIFLMVPTKDNE